MNPEIQKLNVEFLKHCKIYVPIRKKKKPKTGDNDLRKV